MACVADACSADGYVAHLEQAGFRVDRVEKQDVALDELIRAVKIKLAGAELLSLLGHLPPLGADVRAARSLAERAHEAVRGGDLGYVLITGTAAACDPLPGPRTIENEQASENEARSYKQDDPSSQDGRLGHR